MVKFIDRVWLVFLVLLIVGGSSRLLRGADAVVVTGGSTGGGAVTGAAGFTFVPSLSLNVTNLSIYDAALSDAIVNVWSSTNSIIATYDLGPTSNTFTSRSTNVSFALIAGQSYSITVQDGPLSSSNQFSTRVYLPGGGTQVNVAPELTQYHFVTVSPSGGFTIGATNAFIFGVNFSFQPTNLPSLGIYLTNNATSAFVYWPSPFTGFVLQTNANLSGTNWADFPGTINDDGVNKNAVITPPTGKLFFRLRQ